MESARIEDSSKDSAFIEGPGILQAAVLQQGNQTLRLARSISENDVQSMGGEHRLLASCVAADWYRQPARCTRA
jgi:hypothetical protein